MAWCQPGQGRLGAGLQVSRTRWVGATSDFLHHILEMLSQTLRSIPCLPVSCVASAHQGVGNVCFLTQACEEGGGMLQGAWKAGQPQSGTAATVPGKTPPPGLVQAFLLLLQHACCAAKAEGHRWCRVRFSNVSLWCYGLPSVGLVGTSSWGCEAVKS